MSRISLPENFIDFQSTTLLAQPEPQYPLAGLFISSIGQNLGVPAAFGLGVDGRPISGSGAAYSAVDRDRLMIASALPKSLFALGIDFKAQTGSTVRINRPAYLDSTYTMASRRLSSGQPIGLVPVTVGSEQTHLTLERFAGPYDSANSRIAPLSIEAFDAKMGVHSESGLLGNNLQRDFHRFLDSVHVELGSMGTPVYPDGMNADNDAGQTGAYPITVEQLSRTEQLMDEASLPKFPDGKRLMMLTPLQWKQLKHDPEYAANSSFHPEFNILWGGYVGSVGAFHIFQSQTLKRVANSSSVPVQYGIAMAPGCYMGGVGRPPRVVASTDDNYGETAKVVWIADLAFGIADQRFFYSIRSA